MNKVVVTRANKGALLERGAPLFVSVSAAKDDEGDLRMRNWDS